MSDTIFRQQLGRGMRPSKDKLIVLDFVGNIERVRQLKLIASSIAEQYERFTTPEERASSGYVRESLQISGKGFEFTFQDDVVDLVQAIQPTAVRVSRHDRTVDFYAAWQEAAKAAQTLGIKSKEEYNLRYRLDAKLPSPTFLRKWEGFPGWRAFLATGRDLYGTWQEAGAAARGLGIKTSSEYYRRYKEDLRLPGSPHKTLEDFPGWDNFLERKAEGAAPRAPRRKLTGEDTQRLQSSYSNWKLCAKALRNLGISNWTEFRDRLKEIQEKDSRIPGDPKRYYRDYPGPDIFWGRRTSYE